MPDTRATSLHCASVKTAHMLAAAVIALAELAAQRFGVGEA